MLTDVRSYTRICQGLPPRPEDRPGGGVRAPPKAAARDVEGDGEEEGEAQEAEEAEEAVEVEEEAEEIPHAGFPEALGRSSRSIRRYRRLDAAAAAAVAADLREHGAVRWGQPRQHLRREDVGQLLEQPSEHRRPRVGLYQPRLPQASPNSSSSETSSAHSARPNSAASAPDRRTSRRCGAAAAKDCTATGSARGAGWTAAGEFVGCCRARLWQVTATPTRTRLLWQIDEIWNRHCHTAWDTRRAWQNLLKMSSNTELQHI